MELVNKHLVREGNAWVLRSDINELEVKIPNRLTLLIKGMLAREQERNTNQEILGILNKINCHKTILYLANHISERDLVEVKKDVIGHDFTFADQALKISDTPFVYVSSEEELKQYAKRMCLPGKLYIGQIENIGLAHSFIVGKTQDNKYICFDKAGFWENVEKGNKDFKFRVYEIAELLASEGYNFSTLPRLFSLLRKHVSGWHKHTKPFSGLCFAVVTDNSIVVTIEFPRPRLAIFVTTKIWLRLAPQAKNLPQGRRFLYTVPPPRIELGITA